MANSLFNHGYKVIIIDELVDDEGPPVHAHNTQHTMLPILDLKR